MGGRRREDVATMKGRAERPVARGSGSPAHAPRPRRPARPRPAAAGRCPGRPARRPAPRGSRSAVGPCRRPGRRRPHAPRRGGTGGWREGRTLRHESRTFGTAWLMSMIWAVGQIDSMTPRHVAAAPSNPKSVRKPMTGGRSLGAIRPCYGLRPASPSRDGSRRGHPSRGSIGCGPRTPPRRRGRRGR